MKQNMQKGIRGALVFLPLIQTVITLSVQAECKMMDMILLFEMLALGCAGAFCISFGKRMFERLLVVSGMGTLVMVLALSGGGSAGELGDDTDCSIVFCGVFAFYSVRHRAKILAVLINV